MPLRINAKRHLLYPDCPSFLFQASHTKPQKTFINTSLTMKRQLASRKLLMGCFNE
jgi:hypothetical protein